MVRYPLVATNGGQCLQEPVTGNTQPIQHLGDGKIGDCQHSDEQMFLADVFILHGSGRLKSLVQQFFKVLGHVALAGTSPRNFGQLINELVGLAQDYTGFNTHLLQHRNHNPLGLFKDGLEQMFRLHLLVAELLGSVMGCLDCFLGFYSKFIKLHISSSPVFNHSKTKI